ncbi:site-specific DNA-methyltransferase [Pseudonocardia saturnea]
MSRLNDLIRQLRLKDPALADDFEREVGALTDRRAFGLNFERHTPETVELPGRRVRRGDKVRILPPRGAARKQADERLWRVASINRANGERTAALELVDGDTAESVAVTDLVVVAEFREPIYPGMASTGKIERGGDTPFHTVVNAENYHALQTLLFTHRGKVDCIYIDPPYNTGSADWIYNDRYVSGDDLYRHSKWLAFMERRLVLARDLLNDTGVIIVAIGDDEHHRLRMLLDQVFGDINFVSDVVWQGGRKNDSRYVSNGADYMLIYAKDESALSAEGVRWREEKEGLDEVLAQGAKAWSESGGDERAATIAMRAWFKTQPKDSPVQALSRNVWFLPDGTLCRDADTRSPNPRPNLQYDLLHPVTGKPCRMHPNGWVYSRETMDRMIAEGRIIFRSTEKDVVGFKRPLKDTAGNVVQSVFDRLRTHAGRHLESVLSDKRFPYPKDHEVLMRWIKLAAPRDAVVLDFFGGSGTTTEAVMRLNHEDGGTRRSILVTNNELDAKEVVALGKAGFRRGDGEWEAKGIHEYVTRPRITTVITGKRPDGSTFDGAIAANLEFFDLTYEAPLRVASNREFGRIAPLLWMRAGSRGRRIDDISKGWDVADTYGVIADFDHAEEFVRALADQPAAAIAFIVTDEDWLFESMCRALPEYVEPVRLYAAYLRNFELESGRGAR